MGHINFLDTLLIPTRSRKRLRAFTLVELLITVAIIGTLSSIAVPTYNNYMDESRNTTAIIDIQKMVGSLARFQAERGRPPDTLGEAGIQPPPDPWGNPYVYVRLQGLSKHDQDAKCRWDKYDKPLNTDFDLYSMGKDGQTHAKLTDARSHDDIIYAHGGTYVGLVSEY